MNYILSLFASIVDWIASKFIWHSVMRNDTFFTEENYKNLYV